MRRAQLAGAYRRRHDLEHFGRDLADVEHRIDELEAQLPAELVADARRPGEPSVGRSPEASAAETGAPRCRGVSCCVPGL